MLLLMIYISISATVLYFALQAGMLVSTKNIVDTLPIWKRALVYAFGVISVIPIIAWAIISELIEKLQK